MLINRRPYRGARPAVGVAALALSLVAAPPAFASEWVLGPRLSVTGVYDDNVRLGLADNQEAAGILVVPELSLQRRTEVTRLDGRAALRLARYPGEEGLDQDEGRFDLRARRTGERSAWNMTARYRQDTSLRSALDEFAPDDDVGEPIVDDPALDDPDLGLVTVRIRRSRLDLAPRWEYATTPRLTTELGYRYQTVTYGDDEALTSPLLDFDRHRIQTGVRYALTERTQLISTLMAERHRVDAEDERTDNYELRGGVRHQLTERLHASLEAGGRTTRFDTPDERGSSTGFVLDSALAYRTEVTRVRGFLRRTLQPSGAGRSLQTDRLEVRVQRALSDQLEIQMSAHALRTEPLAASGETLPGRRYYELEPQVRWHATEELSFAGWARFRRNKPDGDGEAAQSRAVFVGITYEPRVISLR